MSLKNAYSFSIWLLLISLISIRAEAQKFRWAEDFGSSGDIDFGKEITADNHGNVYTTGHIHNPGNVFGLTLVTGGFFIVKQNAAGLIKWAHTSSRGQPNMGEDVAVDSQGNVIVVGVYGGSINFGDTILVNSNSEASFFMVKYDSMGVVVWARNFSAPFGTGGNQVEVDVDDNIYLSGEFSGSVDFGKGVGVTGRQGQSDIFLARFTPEGSAVWAFLIESYRNQSNTVMAIDGQRIILAGNSEDADIQIKNVSYPLGDSYYSFLLTCDLNGGQVKVKGVKDFIFDFTVNKQGNVFLLANDQTYSGLLIARLAADLSVYDWRKRIDTFSTFTDATIISSGTDVYAGFFFQDKMVVDTITLLSARAAVILKVSSVGVTQWARPFPNPDGFGFTSFASTTPGVVDMVGINNEPSYDLDHHILQNKGTGTDIFIAQLFDSTVSKCILPVTSLIADQTKICDKGQVVLTAKGVTNSSIAWFKDDGQRLPDTGAVIEVGDGGNYYFIINPGDVCSLTSNYIEVDVLKPASNLITSEPVSTICNSPVRLEVQNDPNFTYEWHDESGLVPGGGNSIVVTNSGYYWCIIRNDQQCPVETQQVPIKTIPAEKDFLPDTVQLCGSKSVELSPVGLQYDAWKFQWSDGNNTKMITAQQGTFTLKIFDGSCEYSETVKVLPEKNLVFPNVFTPNGDGLNDYFEIKNAVGDIQLSIYNRWGGNVYRTESYHNDWAAAGVDAGTYFYYATSVACSEQAFRGWLTVIK